MDLLYGWLVVVVVTGETLYEEEVGEGFRGVTIALKDHIDT